MYYHIFCYVSYASRINIYNNMTGRLYFDGRIGQLCMTIRNYERIHIIPGRACQIIQEADPALHKVTNQQNT